MKKLLAMLIIMSGCAVEVQEGPDGSPEDVGVFVGALWEQHYTKINSNAGKSLTSEPKTKTAGMRCFAMNTGQGYDCSDTTCLLVYGSSKPGYQRIDVTDCRLIPPDYAGLNKECNIRSQGGAIRSVMRYYENGSNIEYYVPGYMHAGPYERCDVPNHTLWVR